MPRLEMFEAKIDQQRINDGQQTDHGQAHSSSMQRRRE
jgi:hypothetical protein